jgi:hypothetical protein
MTMPRYAVSVRGSVVTASALRAHGWVECAAVLDKIGGEAVFAERASAEEFAAWMGRTFPEPCDRATIAEA